jgi:hypothetical protein
LILSQIHLPKIIRKTENAKISNLGLAIIKLNKHQIAPQLPLFHKEKELG